MTSVLESTPPRFTASEVAAMAAELFGLRGEATDLGSERDQTFLVAGRGGEGVVKISNLGENPATLELEAAAPPYPDCGREGRPLGGIRARPLRGEGRARLAAPTRTDSPRRLQPRQRAARPRRAGVRNH